MSSVVISGDTSGTVTVTVPAVAGTNTVTIPAVTGNVVLDSATQTLTNKTITSPTISGAVVSSMASSVITSGTAVASTSGTSIDFTSIPNWVKRVTVMFNGVSTSGTSAYLVQIGAGSVTTTGYLSGTLAVQSGATSSGGTTSTAGFAIISANVAAYLYSGTLQIVNLTGNTWIENGNFLDTTAARGSISGGSIALGGTLDRVRITTVNGTDTFDAGSINILYE